MSPFSFPRVNGNLRLPCGRISEAGTTRKNVHSMYLFAQCIAKRGSPPCAFANQSIVALIGSLDKDIDFSVEQEVRKIPSLSEDRIFVRPDLIIHRSLLSPGVKHPRAASASHPDAEKYLEHVSL